MNKTNNLKQLVEELVSLHEFNISLHKFKKNLIRKLGDCPQNPNLQRTSDSCKVFTTTKFKLKKSLIW